MIGTAASFHALPCVLGCTGRWLLCSSTQESEPDSHALPPSRSQRFLGPIVDHFVTKVQVTITASATCSHAEGHQGDLSLKRTPARDLKGMTAWRFPRVISSGRYGPDKENSPYTSKFRGMV